MSQIIVCSQMHLVSQVDEQSGYLRPIAIVMLCVYMLAIYGRSCCLPIRSLWCICAGRDLTC